ncbi:MAG: hypothetical protein DRN53_01815 [Thermoprotei archaeon]|nr:MAG: hypothetical protein DRN53_01815 [Thermoprotei archaeon]
MVEHLISTSLSEVKFYFYRLYSLESTLDSFYMSYYLYYSTQEFMGIQLRKIRCLVTDLDGTLVRLPIDWDYVRAKIRNFLKTNHPLKPLLPSLNEVIQNEELMRTVLSMIEEEEVKAVEKIGKSPKLREILFKLKSRNMKLVLITQQSTRPAKIALSKLGILDLFDLIITRNIVREREEQLRKVIEIMGVSPSEVVFVGDAPWDYEAGTRLGCLTIMVGNRVPSAHIRLSSFLELEKLLDYIL